MDEAVGTFAKYIDFFVLGAIAFLAISTPFKPFQPLLKGWRFLLYQCLPEAILREGRRSPDARGQKAPGADGAPPPPDNSIHYVQIALAAAFLFALFYFAGIAVNGFGHSRLDAAHMLIIKNSYDLTRDGAGTTRPPARLYTKPLWLSSEATPDEKAAYALDAKQQLRWSICDPTSYDAMNGGPTIKHLRLVRGAIGIAILVFITSCIAFLLAWRRKLAERETRWGQLKWPVWSLVGSVSVYAGMLIPMYWNIESNTHTTIAAALPPIESKHYAVPCDPDMFRFAIREKGKFPYVGEEKAKGAADK